jgi:hypothetical protein
MKVHVILTPYEHQTISGTDLTIESYGNVLEVRQSKKTVALYQMSNIRSVWCDVTDLSFEVL